MFIVAKDTSLNQRSSRRNNRSARVSTVDDNFRIHKKTDKHLPASLPVFCDRSWDRLFLIF